MIATADEAIEGLRREGKRRAEANREKQEATERLRRYIEAAREAGVPITRIAREAQVSRQAVYDFLAS